MKLPVLALFERSLRLESRSALMCWLRAGLLVVIMLVLFPIQSMARMGWYGAPGLHFLEQMVWVNFIFVTLAGLSYFASAITEEKEEMMLGLLRMTDLNPIAILLGKSTSRLVGALLLLLVQFPFVLLAVALGGVGLLQIVAAYGTLLAYLFLVCNLALFFSVVFRQTKTAAALTLSLLLAFLIGPYWGAGILGDLASAGHLNLQRGVGYMLTWLIGLWRQATPPDRFGEIFTTGFAGLPVGFQIASNLGLGILWFLLAWLVFERCNRDEKTDAPSRRWRLRRTSRRSRIPHGLIGPLAISWKDFIFISGGTFGWLVKFGVVALLMAVFNLFYLYMGNRKDLTAEFEGDLLILISLLMTAIFLALDAARIFQDEVRWKTLSSLVTLPVSLPELAYRKVAGTLAGTLPLLGATVLGLFLSPADVGKFFDDVFNNTESFGFFVLVWFQFILFLHLTAYFSLVIKRGALALAIAVQFFGGTFLMSFLGMLFFSQGGGADALVFFTIAIGLIMTFVLHAAIGRRLARAAAAE